MVDNTQVARIVKGLTKELRKPITSADIAPAEIYFCFKTGMLRYHILYTLYAVSVDRHRAYYKLYDQSPDYETLSPHLINLITIDLDDISKEYYPNPWKPTRAKPPLFFIEEIEFRTESSL